MMGLAKVPAGQVAAHTPLFQKKPVAQAWHVLAEAHCAQLAPQELQVLLPWLGKAPAGQVALQMLPFRKRVAVQAVQTAEEEHAEQPSGQAAQLAVARLA